MGAAAVGCEWQLELRRELFLRPKNNHQFAPMPKPAPGTCFSL
jgi:hypothetical protein